MGQLVAGENKNYMAQRCAHGGWSKKSKAHREKYIAPEIYTTGNKEGCRGTVRANLNTLVHFYVLQSVSMHTFLQSVSIKV